MSQRPKTGQSWDIYQQGRSSSTSSMEPIAEGSPVTRVSPSATSAIQNIRESDDQNDGIPDLRRRRSSITMRLNSFRQAGGVNSIDNFSKSVQRAAGFRETPFKRRPSISPAAFGIEDSLEPPKGILRQQIEAAGPAGRASVAVQDDGDVDEENGESSRLLSPAMASQVYGSTRFSSYLKDSFPNSLGTSFGTTSTRVPETARRRVSILIERHMEAAAQDPSKEQEPLNTETEHFDDGTVIERIVGESTVPQTIFNSINILIGIGLLALPLGMKHAGWIIGLFFLASIAIVTQYTAKILAKCLDVNNVLGVYSDIALLAFGTVAEAAVRALFTLELVAANVALIILFGDTLHSLIPGFSVLEWKMLASVAFIPLNFAPFKILSVSSILGIFCCFGLVFIIFIGGLLKHEAPGSLLHVSPTYALPADWKTIPLSVGLFMAPWGGHSVFPSVYRDMRHPTKYGKALTATYSFTFSLDLAMAVVGYLMFGDYVKDEVTQNILTSKAYPYWMSIAIVVLIAIIPITKIPLSNRPIQTTLARSIRVDPSAMIYADDRKHSETSVRHKLCRVAIGALVNFAELGIAVVFPDFDSIMALMGSALCLSICVILPVAFNLKLFGHDMTLRERSLDWCLLTVSIALAVIGVVWAILPKEMIGIK